MQRLAGILFFTTILPSMWGQSYNISSFAGGGLPPLPASALAISIGGQYTSVAADESGNVYVADSIAQVVYKVSGGTVTLLAGTGQAGYSGDGGPATSAELNGPSSVAVDTTGAVYISDLGNFRVRKVVNGVISTVAGNGTPGFSGDGGPATAAEIDQLYFLTIAVDANGNLYINEFARIRKVTSNGIINTIAGTGSSGDTGDGGSAVSAEILAYAVAADSNGNVYFPDSTDNVIRKISGAGIINTIAGNKTRGYSGDGGPAIDAQLNEPEGVAVDTSGNVYVADTLNACIRRISVAGTITTFAGSGLVGFSGDGGPATNATLNYPNGVATSANGNLFIADSSNNRVREVTTASVITTIAGNGFINEAGDGGPAVNAQLLWPSAVSATGSGNVYVGDEGNYVLRQVSSAGRITRIAGTGVYGYSGDGGPAVDAEIGGIGGIAQDAIGNIYLADGFDSVVRRVAPDGTITTFAGNGTAGYSGDGQPATTASLNAPEGLVVDSSGNLYIEDNDNEVIRKVDNTSTITTVVGTPQQAGFGGDGGPASAALLEDPQGLAIDVQGNLYIADSGNSRIREVSAITGIITTVAGNGSPGYSGDGGAATSAQLQFPTGIAVDGSGNLYIADAGNNVVRKVSASGIITTIAGTGGFGYSGDNGPAIDATFYYPNSIAVGANGSLYVTDTENGAIRELNVCIQSVTSTAAADATAQTLSIPLTAASTCNWSASNLPSWITNASSGTGSGTLSLTLQANTNGADRSATINVNGLNVSITQDFTAELFQDVTPGVYYFDAVDLLKAKGITNGCTATDYCPAANVTRAEMAIFIVRAIVGGDNFTYSPTPYFTDVQPTDFGFAWIQKLSELGITNGCGPGLYCPNDSITRNQMAVFIIRARYGAQTVFDYPQAPFFTDVPATGFAFNYIQRMKEDNITTGCSATTYCPSNPVTRGDMAVFIMRGAFNQLLPPTEPVILSINPATITNGTTATLTVIGGQTNFVAGSTVVNAVPGLTVNSVTITNTNTLQVSVTANTTATPQPLSIWVTDPTEEAVLPNGLTAQ